MSTLQYATQVPSDGYIALPPEFHGHRVIVSMDKRTDEQLKHERRSRLDEIRGGWKDDDRSTEEIIRDIYESRTIGRERDLL